jgi:hypothetical protein
VGGIRGVGSGEVGGAADDLDQGQKVIPRP